MADNACVLDVKVLEESKKVVGVRVWKGPLALGRGVESRAW